MGRCMIDLTGQRFGMLTVLRKNFEASSAAGHGMFDCLCDCGRTKTIAGYRIKLGRTTSCGCIKGRPAREREEADFLRRHGCSVCADKNDCDMTFCKYEKELTL